MSKLYPDISHHHPVKDWNKIETNCPFIITKATQGTSFVDSALKKSSANVKNERFHTGYIHTLTKVTN